MALLADEGDLFEARDPTITAMHSFPLHESCTLNVLHMGGTLPSNLASRPRKRPPGLTRTTESRVADHANPLACS